MYVCMQETSRRLPACCRRHSPLLMLTAAWLLRVLMFGAWVAVSFRVLLAGSFLAALLHLPCWWADVHRPSRTLVSQTALRISPARLCKFISPATVCSHCSTCTAVIAGVCSPPPLPVEEVGVCHSGRASFDVAATFLGDSTVCDGTSAVYCMYYYCSEVRATFEQLYSQL